MYGIMLVVTLVLTGGIIAFIGDRLGSKVGKKRLSLFGLRPRHTSIIVTIITGILITTSTLTVLAIVSKDVRTALFGMEKIRAEMEHNQQTLKETADALSFAKDDLESTKKEYADAQNELASSQEELAAAKSASEQLRAEQATLQAKNQELWSANQTLVDTNGQLLSDNKDLMQNNSSLKADNNSLKENNTSLQKLNDDLQEGIDNMREKPIIYRVGELLASGIIKKTNNPEQIQNDLGQIVSLANSKIVDRLGAEGAKDGVWIYPATYQEAINRLQNAPGDTVVRLIVAANLVKGDPVLTDLELHPNRTVYQQGELIYEKTYIFYGDTADKENLISDFLRNVNMQAVNKGILPNPLTGAVGVINGNQIYALQKSLQEAKGDVTLHAYAVQNTDVLGPLRLNIVLTQPGGEHSE